MSCTFGLSELFDIVVTPSNLGLSLVREVRIRSKSEIECEGEIIEDPNYSPPPTPCSESYEMEEMSEGSGGSGRSGEEEGEVIPSTILDVDNSRGKCYNEVEDMVGEVMGYDWDQERAYLVPNDHWMLLYAYYMVAGLRCPIPELLVALLKNYGLRLTQLIPDVGGSNKEKGWFYFTPRMVGECGRTDAEVEELCRWKRKKMNSNKYKLSEGEYKEVERLKMGDEEVADIMHLTSLEMLDAIEVYGKSSLSGEMNQLMIRGKTVRLLEKRSKTPTLVTVEERVEGGTSRPHQSGEA
ncbi:hypothetical protein SLEP1_g17354 [Rubroshorea leprosula]|uniref:Uncharacterized protein n=1 Tax=Rubroshorea leprosula TaxID=152421 RepID=A0AAV5J368_9ROSI|nr:hypothetical protein SLEP1_g17354 [Rubroshorea leprosula]